MSKTSHTPSKIRLTYQDYARTPEGEIWELIDGEKFMPPSPSAAHQGVAVELTSLLHGFVKGRSLGRVYVAPFDVVLSDVDVVQPDLLFVSKGREHIITPANVRGAPDLVIEIRSPSTSSRDWTIKRGLYARYGVNEYWVVDPDERKIWVLLLGDDGFDEVGSYGIGDVLTSPTLEGLTIGLDDIFQP